MMTIYFIRRPVKTIACIAYCLAHYAFDFFDFDLLDLCLVAAGGT